LRQTISTKVAEDPQYYESLRLQLEQLIAADAQRRKEEAELLKSLLEIEQKEEKREEEARARGLNLDELAFYSQFAARQSCFAASDEQKQKLAKEIVGEIRSSMVIDWMVREDVQKQMRRKIKDLLRSAGFPYDELEAFTRELMDLARARFKDL
jgi:type I restriction enzyme R subunit